jgi:hypothetical protein
LIVGVLLTCGAVMLADSSQDRTQQPGQPTQAKVWIQNRGEAEAVPVNIRNDSSAPPLSVQVMGVPTAALNAAGADGWDTTGVTLAEQGRTIVVMKRPR